MNFHPRYWWIVKFLYQHLIHSQLNRSKTYPVYAAIRRAQAMNLVASGIIGQIAPPSERQINGAN
jgi:hypothetical protein